MFCLVSSHIPLRQSLSESDVHSVGYAGWDLPAFAHQFWTCVIMPHDHAGSQGSNSGSPMDTASVLTY